jgi:hypothetical protein
MIQTASMKSIKMISKKYDDNGFDCYRERDSQLYYGSEIGMSGDKDKGDVIFAKISWLGN